MKIELPWRLQYVYIVKETLGRLGQRLETLFHTNHVIRWQNSDFCQK